MSPYFEDESVTLYHGDALEVVRGLPSTSVDCIVTSPPYFGLRSYGEDRQWGMESSPWEYVERLRLLFGELRRVLADDGTCWLNLGDSYQSTGGGKGVGPNAQVRSTLRQATERTRPQSDLPNKNLMGMPWRVAFALQGDGWILRSDIVWWAPNKMPESVTDRPSSRYEHVFLLVKSPSYWFDLDAIREPCVNGDGPTWEERKAAGAAMERRLNPEAPGFTRFVAHSAGKNPGDVWSISTQPFPDAHHAVFPVALPQRCIIAGCKPGGVVLDPFSGSGTTGLAAQRTGRRYIGVDLNRRFLDLSLRTRLSNAALDL